MNHQLLTYRGCHVVWLKNSHANCMTFHLAKLPRNYKPGAPVKTLCGKQGWFPIIRTNDFEDDMNSGEHNCRVCWSKANGKANGNGNGRRGKK